MLTLRPLRPCLVFFICCKLVVIQKVSILFLDIRRIFRLGIHPKILMDPKQLLLRFNSSILGQIFMLNMSSKSFNLAFERSRTLTSFMVHPFSLDDNLDENLELFFGLSIPFLDCKIGVQGIDEAFSFVFAKDLRDKEPVIFDPLSEIDSIPEQQAVQLL